MQRAFNHSLISISRRFGFAAIKNINSISFNNNNFFACASNGILSNSINKSLRHFSVAAPADLDVRPGRLTRRVSHVLAMKPESQITIHSSATVDEAISHMVVHGISSILVQDSDDKVCGFFTARDLFRFVHTHGEEPLHSSGSKGKRGKQNALKQPVKTFMTTKDKIIFCSPEDSVRRCREIMFQLKIRNMPVLDDGKISGIITIKDLADSAFTIKDTGGKAGFIHNVTGRRGLPEGIIAAQKANIKQTTHMEIDVGSYALPHPFKHELGVAAHRRQYGADELATDLKMCEDAHFALRVQARAESSVDEDAIELNSIDPMNHNSSNSTSQDYEVSDEGGLSAARNEQKPVAEQVYVCVADGVGSWRSHGVDPRQFSHRLVEHAKRVVELDAQHRSMGASGWAALSLHDLEPMHPLDVIIEAWTSTLSEAIPGSSTICVATIDAELGLLNYSNLGDCGIMVIRRIDTETAGYTHKMYGDRASTISAYGSKDSNYSKKHSGSEMQIVFLSQQQLKGFNLPYQLGCATEPGHPSGFETPADADTGAVPIMPGDTIILATDGLFDNLHLDDIVAEVENWETNVFQAKSNKDSIRNSTSQLSKRLVEKAREYSLDNSRDSPFAILAKENDIMWGGGMPDDTSVVCMRVGNSIQD